MEEVLRQDLVHLQQQSVAGTVGQSEVRLVLQEKLPVSKVLLNVLVDQIIEMHNQERVGKEQRILYINVLLHFEILGELNLIFIHKVK
jgi:hypothetical protein